MSAIRQNPDTRCQLPILQMICLDGQISELLSSAGGKNILRSPGFDEPLIREIARKFAAVPAVDVARDRPSSLPRDDRITGLFAAVHESGIGTEPISHGHRISIR